MDHRVERCRGYFDLQGTFVRGGGGTPLTNLCFRRNICANHWTMSGSAHAHGLFAYNIDGLLMEGNVFHHNGWNPEGDRATPMEQGGPTVRNHNVYLSRPIHKCVSRFNIFSAASSHGIHFRDGGYLHDNLFIKNPISWQYGYGGDANDTNYGLANPGEVFNNIAIGSDDITTSMPRGQFGWMTCVDGVKVYNNLAINNGSSPVNDCFLWAERTFPIKNVAVYSNKAVDWQGGVSIRPGGYVAEIVETNNNWTAKLSQTALTEMWALYDMTFTDAMVKHGSNIFSLKKTMDIIRQGVN